MSKRRIYAAVPEPYANVNSLYASVLALKELVEGLTGQRGGAEDQAVMKADLPDPPQVKQGAWELIEAVDVYSAPYVDFKNLENYREVRFTGSILPGANGNFQPMIRMSANNGASFLSGAADYMYVGHAKVSPSTNVVSGASAAGHPTMISEYLSWGVYASLEIQLYMLNRATYTNIKTAVGGQGSLNHIIQSDVSGVCASNLAHNCFRIFDGTAGVAFHLFGKLEGMRGA